MIVMGSTVKDRVTGLQGVVTGYCQYITGCHQALVVPKVGKGGEFKEPHWIDEQRLVRVGTSVIVLDNGATPGFDKAPPKR